MLQQILLPVFMMLFVKVSGFMEKGWKTPRLTRTICQCSAAASNTVRGQTSSIPSSISGTVKNEYSLLAALAGAGMIIFPKVTKAVMPGTLGVDSEGFFDVCSDSPLDGCVSSQDDRPACFLAPWEYEGNYLNAKTKVLKYLSLIPGLRVISGGQKSTGGTLDFQSPEENTSRYIRAEVVDLKNKCEDDIEFYFTPNDSTIQYRSMRRKGVDIFALENKNRIEKMRIALRFQNIPILRNRRRVLFFVESPLDSFGPPTIMFDKLLDNISGEMEFKNGVVGDLDPMSPIWETPSTAARKINKK